MISPEPNCVRVIVDPAFGEQLAGVAADAPVWIVSSPMNTPVAHRLWNESVDYATITAITTFQPGFSGAENDLLCLLGTINEHHGESSAGPPYSVLEVIGCTVSDRVVAALAQFAFSVTTSSQDGFSASRDLPLPR